MQVDILIQNVSDQCIPNLVAIRTYRPKRVIWVYTPEKIDVLERLKKASGLQENRQEVWEVNARDSEALQRILLRKMRNLPSNQLIIYHLTSGTKSMSLQGMGWLMAQKHLQTKHKLGVVMDPKAQSFDAVLPSATNNMTACASLSLKDILQVHGSWQQPESGQQMHALLLQYDQLCKLRLINKLVISAINGKEFCNEGEAKNNNGFYYIRGMKQKRLPNIIEQALQIAQDIGVVRRLECSAHGFRYERLTGQNPVAYIQNLWLEDWVAAVLAKYDDGHWKGGLSGVKVSIKAKADFQEFDFLGARKNHLVYWSCKNTKEVKSPTLFEVDALRDEVGGRDFHIAGLVHTASIEHGIRAKAKRLGVLLVNAFDNDAEEKLVNMSCQ